MSDIALQKQNNDLQPAAGIAVPPALGTLPAPITESSEIAALLQQREQTDVAEAKQAIAKALGVSLEQLEQEYRVEYQQNLGRDDFVSIDISELKAGLGEQEFAFHRDKLADTISQALPASSGVQTTTIDQTVRLGFALATSDQPLQSLDKNHLESLSDASLIAYTARHYNSAAGISDAVEREAAFGPVKQALDVLASRQLNNYDQFLIDGYTIATNAKSGILPSNSNLETLQRFAGSEYFSAASSEFPADAASTVEIAKRYSKNIRTQDEVARLQQFAAGYQPSAMIEQIFQAEHLAGASAETIEIARAELGTIVNDISADIKAANISEPREIMAHIHKYLAESYQWKYGTEKSLVDGLVSHNLDCDTVSAIYCEVGKQMDYPIEMTLIRGKPYSHAVAKWDDGKDSFYWDSISPTAAAAEKDKGEIRDSMRHSGTKPARKFKDLSEQDVVQLLALQESNIYARMNQIMTEGAKIASLDNAEVAALRLQATEILKLPAVAEDPISGLLLKVLNQSATQQELNQMRSLAGQDDNVARFAAIVEAISERN